MKFRSALLAFAFLLLMGSLASASSTASADAPASFADGGVALMTPADGSSGCPTDELAFLNPAPSERATGPCGPCSQTNCRGGQIGQGCGFSGGRWYTCQYPYAESCTDGKPKCYCWTAWRAPRDLSGAARGALVVCQHRIDGRSVPGSAGIPAG